MLHVCVQYFGTNQQEKEKDLDHPTNTGVTSGTKLPVKTRVANRSVRNGDWTLSSKAQSPLIEVIMAMQQRNTSGNNGNERRGSLVEETH